MKMGKRRTGIWAVVALVVFMGGYVAAKGIVRGEGVLTEIEKGRTVTIDERGYIVSPSAEIFDEEKKPISLDQISPPHKVYFEYESTKEGALIIYLWAMPKQIPR